MSRGILEFTLPEERVEHQQAVHAAAAWHALHGIEAMLRAVVKYDSQEFPTTQRLAEHLRHEIADTLSLIEQ